MNAIIFFVLAGLLVLDACHTQMPAEPPYNPPPPTVVAPEPPHPVEQSENRVPKNLDEHDHLKLLEGQLDWMKKRIKNEKQEWNDR